MVFTSTVFLFAFLPLALLAFYVVPARWRSAPLLFMSAVFYAWGEPVLVVLILLTGLFTFWWGKVLLRAEDDSRRRSLLWLGIGVTLVPLALFKYLDFALVQLHLDGAADRVNLPLPIGVSFYTFMAIGYLIDIYRRRDTGAPHLLTFFGFLTMFPHLVAGPIVRWVHVGPQLAAPRFDPGLFGYGALRVAGGLAKKAVLADKLALVVDQMFATGEPRSAGAAWVAMILYSLQIYLDFSAYSDIAIGLAAMMGVRFQENFQYPYVARSAREFWQRWHISLGSWFRDYLYIPLGGSRVSPAKLWRNLLVVWAVTGLWHGAAWTFVLWGLYYGVIIGLERTAFGRAVERLPVPLQHTYGVLVAVWGWVLFRSTSTGQALDYYQAMFGLEPGLSAWDGTAGLAVEQTWVIVLLAGALAAGVARPLMERVERAFAPERDHERAPAPRATVPAGPSPSPGGTAPTAPDGGTTPTAPGGGTAPTVPDGGTTPTVPAGAAGSPLTPGAVALASPDDDGAPYPQQPRTDVSPLMSVLVTLAVVVLLTVSTAAVVATTYSPFIYFRF